MLKNIKYLRVFKIAGIAPYDGEVVCSLLSESTLDKLTRVGFHRGAIKPVLQEAQNMQGGINDENINKILKNQNLMTSIISKHCQ